MFKYIVQNSKDFMKINSKNVKNKINPKQFQNETTNYYS